MTKEISIARKLRIVLMALGATFACTLTAFAQIKTLNLAGTGTFTLTSSPCSDIQCASGHTCECLTLNNTVTGNPTAPQGFNNDSLTIEMSIDQSVSPLPISNAGNCLPAGGNAQLNDPKRQNFQFFSVSG